jgi:hypothetical protein
VLKHHSSSLFGGGTAASRICCGGITTSRTCSGLQLQIFVAASPFQAFSVVVTQLLDFFVNCSYKSLCWHCSLKSLLWDCNFKSLLSHQYL